MLKKLVLVLAFIVVAVVVSSVAQGADFVAVDPVTGTLTRSASSAILGAESWYSGALPPPGWHLLNYNLYYYASEIKGKSGRRISTPPFRDFEATVMATVFRPIYVADFTILGATPAWHVVVPIVYKKQRTDFVKDTMEGIGDIYFSPLILGWHKPPFHWAAGLDIIAPTGRYSSHDLSTIGNNHWTFEPAFAASYIGANGFTASTKLMYDIHTTDTTLHYREGQQFHLDYNVGYVFHKAKALKVGLSGYWLISLEDDKVSSNKIHNSGERVFAIGPSVGIQTGKLCANLNIQKEFSARNRPEGTSSWLNFIYSF